MISLSEIVSGAASLLGLLLPAYAVGFTLFLILHLTPEEKAVVKQTAVRWRPAIIGTVIGVVVLFILQALVLPLPASGLWQLPYFLIRIASAIVFQWILPSLLPLYAFAITLAFICLRRPQYNDMLRYIGKRLVTFIPTLLIISIVIFFIIQLPPGDYVDSYVSAMSAEGEEFTEAEIAELRAHFGLDDPWYIQYIEWMDGIITEGDFGYSFEYGRDVWAVIMEYLPMTMFISIIILVFQYGVSLPIGIYCANHQYSPGDYTLSFIGFIGTATPNFLLAIIIYYVLYINTDKIYLGLFSPEMMQAGFGTLPLGELWSRLPELTHFIPELLLRFLLPLLVIGTSGTCGIIRTVRAQMLDEQSRQYILCARAKGCSEATITYKYCLRAALNPVVSGMAGSLRTIFSGSTVSAKVMQLLILGPVLLTAIMAQDMYLAGTIVLVQAVLVLVGTLLSDIALAWLDPRIRFSERG